MTAAGAAAAAAGAAAAAASAAAVSAASINLARSATRFTPPSGGSTARTWQTVLPPPIEQIGLAYYTPLMAPTPVGTRVPQPSKTEDTINGFLRLEAAGGALRPDGILFDMGLILSAYANNTDEWLAENLIGQAIAWGANAQGYVQQYNGNNWYITYSRCTSTALRRADPLVNMTRYRAMVTWRIPGIPLVPGSQLAVPRPATPPPPRPNAPRPSRRR